MFCGLDNSAVLTEFPETSVLFVIFVSSFQWHACELAELSACIAKCMTTINMI